MESINGVNMNPLRKRLWNLVYKARFRLQQATALVRRALSRGDVVVRVVLFIGLALGLAAFINFAEDPHRDTGETITGVLIAMGSLFGGVLAIVFALSSFMQQNAADLYSSQFYDVYVHDWREKVTFAFIAFLTISSFGLALFQSAATIPLGQPTLISVLLVMIAAVLSLVDWQYKRVTKKVNPIEALNFLERECLKSLTPAAETPTTGDTKRHHGSGSGAGTLQAKPGRCHARAVRPPAGRRLRGLSGRDADQARTAEPAAPSGAAPGMSDRVVTGKILRGVSSVI